MAFLKQNPDKELLETGPDFSPRFNQDGLIPCIAQDAETGEVVMFAYMNATSLAKTIETGKAWYWSRSRQELWNKGATSGSIQTVHELKTDCDQDVVLIKVTTAGDGSNCHRRLKSCFYRTLTPNPTDPASSRLSMDDSCDCETVRD